MKKLRNRFEKKIYSALKRAKVEFSYESQKIPYVLAGHYIPDFVLKTPTGLLYIEAKGYLRPEHKRKMVAVKRQHPDKDIRILFYRRTTGNVKWAERNGFKYAIEKVPLEWLKGM